MKIWNKNNNITFAGNHFKILTKFACLRVKVKTFFSLSLNGGFIFYPGSFEYTDKKWFIGDYKFDISSLLLSQSDYSKLVWGDRLCSAGLLILLGVMDLFLKQVLRPLFLVICEIIASIKILCLLFMQTDFWNCLGRIEVYDSSSIIDERFFRSSRKLSRSIFFRIVRLVLI